MQHAIQLVRPSAGAAAAAAAASAGLGAGVKASRTGGSDARLASEAAARAAEKASFSDWARSASAFLCASCALSK